MTDLISHKTKPSQPPAQKPLILILPQAYPQERKPPRRSWKVSQVVPLVTEGLARSGTHAVEMLNLSALPVESSPKRCLAWARLFHKARKEGRDVKTAVRVADESL
jgi:hypothetical protein